MGAMKEKGMEEQQEQESQAMNYPVQVKCFAVKCRYNTLLACGRTGITITVIGGGAPRCVYYCE